MIDRKISTARLFHLSFLAQDLTRRGAFYADVLGCEIGRSSDNWVDFVLFGLQMSAHLRPGAAAPVRDANVALRGGRTVPVPHFGVVLLMDEWESLLRGWKPIPLLTGSKDRRSDPRGRPDSATLFIRDPSGNALEFKGFRALDDRLAPRS